jgi:hypothetical protein
MGLKISKVFRTLADQSVANSIVTVPIVGLSVLVAAFERIKIYASIPFDGVQGGGFRFSIIPPAGVIAQVQSFAVLGSPGFPDVTLSLTQRTQSDFTDPVGITLVPPCNLIINAFIENGPNAGFITLRFGQNNPNITPITIYRGATMEADTYTNF